MLTNLRVAFLRLPLLVASRFGRPAWSVAFGPPDEGQPVPPNSNTLTDAEKAAGWKLLFDGKSHRRMAQLQEAGCLQRLAGDRCRALPR